MLDKLDKEPFNLPKHLQHMIKLFCRRMEIYYNIANTIPWKDEFNNQDLTYPTDWTHKYMNQLISTFFNEYKECNISLLELWKTYLNNGTELSPYYKDSEIKKGHHEL